jgi:hypothetical protein
MILDFYQGIAVTIAISLKVHDGLGLASDSASTIMMSMAGVPDAVVNVYDNANKITNLCKGRPIGAVVWGAGSIGAVSLSTLLKDLRIRFTQVIPGHDSWVLDDNNSTVQHVANRVRQFVYEEKYVQAYGAGAAANKPSMGILVAGYSVGQLLPEAWLIQVNQGDCPLPSLAQPPDQVGCFADGQPEAIHRFVQGYGTGLRPVLEQLGVGPLLIDGVMNQIAQAMSVPMIIPPMPIQDAIDFADFLVHLTKMYSRFGPGAPTVGGPTEIAAITKHEGFKWIKRKHYFDPRLNP